MSDPFLTYAKKATSPVPAKLIGITKTRAEAKALYTQIVGELHKARSLDALRTVLETHRLSIMQFQAELEFLWFGDGHDFVGLEREIERAFEGAEAAQFFTRFPTGSAERVCEAGRLPGR